MGYIIVMDSLVRSILLPTIIMGGIALILGIIIALVSKAFHLESNKLLDDILSVLPQANCGACGFPGCSGYAQWLASGGGDSSKCPVGGNELSAALAEIIGSEAKAMEVQIAYVMCKGTDENTSKRYLYSGTDTCATAHSLFLGPNSCTYGCIGFGDCVTACPYAAIDIVDGIAVINEIKCKSCEKCIPSCPKKIIFMVPKGRRTYKIECMNHDTGANTRKQCKVGCIACQRCFKICPTDAIRMEDNLAIIDPYKCIDCGKCFEVCPTNTIGRPDDAYRHL